MLNAICNNISLGLIWLFCVFFFVSLRLGTNWSSCITTIHKHVCQSRVIHDWQLTNVGKFSGSQFARRVVIDVSLIAYDQTRVNRVILFCHDQLVLDIYGLDYDRGCSSLHTLNQHLCQAFSAYLIITKRKNSSNFTSGEFDTANISSPTNQQQVHN